MELLVSEGEVLLKTDPQFYSAGGFETPSRPCRPARSSVDWSGKLGILRSVAQLRWLNWTPLALTATWLDELAAISKSWLRCELG